MRNTIIVALLLALAAGGAWWWVQRSQQVADLRSATYAAVQAAQAVRYSNPYSRGGCEDSTATGFDEWERRRIDAETRLNAARESLGPLHEAVLNSSAELMNAGLIVHNEHMKCMKRQIDAIGLR